ncbi:MAG: pentapeptide repeat-containing protein [Myxococcota bacterium]
MQPFFTHPIQLASAPVRHVTTVPGAYQFIHPDFRDFFATTMILKQKKLDYILDKKLLSKLMISFLVHNTTIDHHFRQKLWSYIQKKRKTKTAIIAASNSFRMLCAIGHQDFSKESLAKLDLSGVDLSNIKLPKDLSGTDLRKAKLPRYLSGLNLTNAILEGQYFTYTNFAKAKLVGAKLSNTTCDYKQCFEDNVDTNNLLNVSHYFHCIGNTLSSITEVYPDIAKNKHKAALLQIASDLAYLPYYKDVEHCIKVNCLFYRLLCVKDKIKKLGSKLYCQLHWTKGKKENLSLINYPWYLEEGKGKQIASLWCILSTKKTLPRVLSILIQDYLIETTQSLHADFDKYMQLWQEKSGQYLSTKGQQTYGEYKIKKIIQGLKKAYPKLTSETLKTEAKTIARCLSESYKLPLPQFRIRFFLCQNRLVDLKLSAVEAAKNDICYFCSVLTLHENWHE